MSKDTYLFQTINERSSGPSHVTVNENRAPTDDSIRIYQEMLEKAEKNITKLFKVDNNSLKCSILSMYDSETYSKNIAAIIELNGVRKTIKQEVLMTERETLNALMEEMSKVIAYEMLVPALEEFFKHGERI